MGNLLRSLGALVGSVLTVGGMFWISIFMLFSLPFAVIALMRWFGFSWWGALIPLVPINLIPFVAWIRAEIASCDP